MARTSVSVLEEQRRAVGAGRCRRRAAWSNAVAVDTSLQGILGMLARRRDLVDEVAGLARANLEEAVRQVEVIEKLSERVSG